MPINFEVRRAEPADARDMARVHVQTWRETYRGLMSDAVLDDPALLDWRERFWAAALTHPRYEKNTVTVAAYEGAMIGIAMSGPSPDGADESTQLHGVREIRMVRPTADEPCDSAVHGQDIPVR